MPKTVRIMASVRCRANGFASQCGIRREYIAPVAYGSLKTVAAVMIRSASASLGGEPRRRIETDRNHQRKNDRSDEQVCPAQNRDGRKTKSEGPHREAHAR